MPLQGTYRKLFGRFKFIVRVLGTPFQSMAFQSCSAIKMSIGVATYREGGALAAYKEPALAEFEDITLARGICYDTDMWQWVLEVVDVQANLPGGMGLQTPDHVRDLVVVQLDRDQTEAIKWRLYWAFPRDYEASEFDNNAEEISMETLILAYHHFDREDIGAP